MAVVEIDFLLGVSGGAEELAHPLDGGAGLVHGGKGEWLVHLSRNAGADDQDEAADRGADLVAGAAGGSNGVDAAAAAELQGTGQLSRQPRGKISADLPEP